MSITKDLASFVANTNFNNLLKRVRGHALKPLRVVVHSALSASYRFIRNRNRFIHRDTSLFS